MSDGENMVKRVLEGEDPKDFLQRVVGPRFFLKADDFSDPDDWLNFLWVFKKIPEHLALQSWNRQDVPAEVWAMTVPVTVGGTGYYINPDIMRDWPGLLRRFRMPEDEMELNLQ